MVCPILYFGQFCGYVFGLRMFVSTGKFVSRVVWIYRFSSFFLTFGFLIFFTFYIPIEGVSAKYFLLLICTTFLGYSISTCHTINLLFSDEIKDFEIATELFKKIKGRKEKVVHDAKIYFDNKQYSIRIPNYMAKSIGIDVEKDIFRLIYTPDSVSDEEGRAKLTGELIKG